MDFRVLYESKLNQFIRASIPSIYAHAMTDVLLFAISAVCTVYYAVEVLAPDVLPARRAFVMRFVIPFVLVVLLAHYVFGGFVFRRGHDGILGQGTLTKGLVVVFMIYFVKECASSPQKVENVIRRLGILRSVSSLASVGTLVRQIDSSGSPGFPRHSMAHVMMRLGVVGDDEKKVKSLEVDRETKMEMRKRSQDVTTYMMRAFLCGALWIFLSLEFTFTWFPQFQADLREAYMDPKRDSSQQNPYLVMFCEFVLVVFFSSVFMPVMCKIIVIYVIKSVNAYGDFCGCGRSHFGSLLSPAHVMYQAHKDSVEATVYLWNTCFDMLRFFFGRFVIFQISDPVLIVVFLLKDVVYSLWHFGVKYSPAVMTFAVKAWHPEGRRELHRHSWMLYQVALIMDKWVVFESLLLKITTHWTFRLDYRKVRMTNSVHQSTGNAILELPKTGLSLRLRFSNLCFVIEHVPLRMFGDVKDSAPTKDSLFKALGLQGSGIGMEIVRDSGVADEEEDTDLGDPFSRNSGNEDETFEPVLIGSVNNCREPDVSAVSSRPKHARSGGHSGSSVRDAENPALDARMVGTPRTEDGAFQNATGLNETTELLARKSALISTLAVTEADLFFVYPVMRAVRMHLFLRYQARISTKLCSSCLLFMVPCAMSFFISAKNNIKMPDPFAVFAHHSSSRYTEDDRKYFFVAGTYWVVDVLEYALIWWLMIGGQWGAGGTMKRLRRWQRIFLLSWRAILFFVLLCITPVYMVVSNGHIEKRLAQHVYARRTVIFDSVSHIGEASSGRIAAESFLRDELLPCFDDRCTIAKNAGRQFTGLRNRLWSICLDLPEWAAVETESAPVIRAVAPVSDFGLFILLFCVAVMFLIGIATKLAQTNFRRD